MKFGVTLKFDVSSEKTITFGINDQSAGVVYGGSQQTHYIARRNHPQTV